MWANHEHNLIFFPFFFSSQKNKRQAAYEGIKYDKLNSSGDVKSPLNSSGAKLILSVDDVELSHEKLQRTFEEAHDDEGDAENDDDEETRFINNNRSSFYTSSERTWSITINTQIIL